MQDSLVLSSFPLVSSLLRRRVSREEVECGREEDELREEVEDRREEEVEAKPELREEEDESCLLSVLGGWIPAWLSSSLVE